MKYNFLTGSKAFTGAAVLLLSITAFGQAISISGVVKNRATDAAVPGASVALEGTGLSTVTDATGAFTLTGQGTGILPGPAIALSSATGVTTDNRGIQFDLISAGPISIAFYTLGGKSVSEFKQDNLGKGQWHYSPRLAPGVYICKAKISHTLSTFKYLALDPQLSSSPTSRGAALIQSATFSKRNRDLGKQSAVAYTLVTAKTWFDTNRTVLSSPTANNVLVLLDSTVAKSPDTNFYAYYTRLPFDDKGNTGKYADIVVKISGLGSFIFSRENSYQPYWSPAATSMRYPVSRIVPRIGDGPSERPDKINKCSNASIVENTPGHVKIHWRYAPNIMKQSFTDFKTAYNIAGNAAPFYTEYVDEYFDIKADGTVARQVKTGTVYLDDWNDPKNVATQNLVLTAGGITLASSTSAQVQNLPGAAIAGETVKTGGLAGYVRWWKFDEGLGPNARTTKESVTGTDCQLKGVDANWKKGVSGTSLSFDSYSNAVVLPSAQCPSITGSITIEAWIAPQEYPFDWAAIVDHNSGNNGYFLGMNSKGEIGFNVGVGGTWPGVLTPMVPLYKWSHILAVYDQASGFTVYINGAAVSTKAQVGALSDASATDLSIGMTRTRTSYPVGSLFSDTPEFKTNMVFSGLIDELKIFDKVLSSSEATAEYATGKPTITQSLQPWVFPAGPATASRFGAQYTNLKYSPEWDGLWRVGDYSDIVVTFDTKPWRYVFWRGTRYLPSLVTNSGSTGIWSSDQSAERFTGICHEHMSDMQCRYSNARLVENSDARVIVHWRVASVNIAYQWTDVDPDGWGLWTDEYWTIYPDGVSVRYQLCHNATPAYIDQEMNQNEILHMPGQTTEDLLPNDAITVANTNGGTQTIYHIGSPTADPGGDKNLQFTNLKSATKHFEIGEIGASVQTFITNNGYWNGWSHYPAQLIPSDGTQIFLHDRPSSTCPSTMHEVRRVLDSKTLEAMTLYGLTDGPVTGLTGLNRSWNYTPPVSNVQGCDSLVYEKRERAWKMNKSADTVRFTLAASSSSPIVNPAFTIKKWGNGGANVSLKIDGASVTPGPDFRRGVVIDPDGTRKLVIWLRYSATKSVSFEISHQ